MSSEFRKFSTMMKGKYPYLAHTLIVNVFNVFAGFVKLVKNSHVIHEVKFSRQIDLKHARAPILIMRQLLE